MNIEQLDITPDLSPDEATLNPPKRSKKKVFKIIRKILISFFAAITFLLLLLAVLGTVFENKITDRILKKLYQSSNVEITHQDASFSLIRRFPSAALKINKISVGSSLDKTKLLTAENVFIQLNVLQLIRSDYVVNRIEINNADLRMKINRQGKNNWQIFSMEDTTDDLHFEVKLKAITLNKVNYIFENEENNLYINIFANRLKGKGTLENQVISSVLDGNLDLLAIRKDSTCFVRNRHLEFHSDLTIDLNNNKYTVKRGDFDFDILRCQIKGEFKAQEPDYRLKLHVATPSASIEKLISVLPQEVKNKIKDFDLKGDLGADVFFDAVFSDHTLFSLSGTYSIRKTKITNVQTQIAMEDVNAKGRFSMNYPNVLPSLSIKLETFSAKINNGDIAGSFDIQNLETPLVALDIQAHLNLEDWQNFIPQNYIHKTTGKAKIDLQFNHCFSDIKNITAEELNKSSINGSVVFSNVLLQLKEGETSLEELNGELLFNNQIIKANRLTGVIKENTFEMNGKIENIFPYLMSDDADLQIAANLSIAHFDLDKFLQESSTPVNKTKESRKLSFPNHIYFDLAFQSAKMTYQNFKGENASARVILSGKNLSINNLSINAFGGKVNAQGSISNQANGNFAIKCDAELKNIGIDKLFYGFDNFGQNQLTNKNIKGLAHSNIAFSTTLYPDVSIDQKSLKVLATININNGKLINFKPLEALSSFISLSELNNIEFANLSTEIKIEDRKIMIPEILIRNNVLNLNLYGWQSFDNDLDYHIQVSLKELLSKKLRSSQKAKEDFGDIVDDNTGHMNLHLLVTGNLDNMKFKWDNVSANKGLKQQLTTQKEAIKKEIQSNKVDTSKSTQPSNRELNDSKKKQADIEIGDDW